MFKLDKIQEQERIPDIIMQKTKPWKIRRVRKHIKIFKNDWNYDSCTILYFDCRRSNCNCNGFVNALSKINQERYAKINENASICISRALFCININKMITISKVILELKLKYNNYSMLYSFF